MAKSAGNLCLIKKNAVTIAGGRTVGLSVGGSPITITDQLDDGFQKLLAGAITGKALEFTIEGLEDGQVLRDIALGAATGRFMTDITFHFPNGDNISGPVFMSAYTEGGPYEDAQTFSATFMTDGEYTFAQAI